MNLKLSLFLIPALCACATTITDAPKNTNDENDTSTEIDIQEDTASTDTDTEEFDTAEPDPVDTGSSELEPEDTEIPEETDTPEEIITIAALQSKGSYTYTETLDSRSVNSCDSPIGFTHVETSMANAPTVFLAHGFSRSSSNMMGWAQHWASWGFDVVVVDMCHWMDHVANGEAISELSTALGISSPIFAGQSAGGMASFIAASSSTGSAGVLGLDATDDISGSGRAVAPQVSVPVLGLAGEPSDCNANNSGVDMLKAAPNATLLRVNDADHCDFESPTDGLCTVFCQNTTATISEQNINSTVLSLSTAGLLWLSGLEPAASDLWIGSQQQTLIGLGLVESIQ